MFSIPRAKSTQRTTSVHPPLEFQSLMAEPALSLPQEGARKLETNHHMKRRVTVARVQRASVALDLISPTHQADPQQTQETLRWGARGI